DVLLGDAVPRLQLQPPALSGVQVEQALIRTQQVRRRLDGPRQRRALIRRACNGPPDAGQRFKLLNAPLERLLRSLQPALAGSSLPLVPDALQEWLQLCTQFLVSHRLADEPPHV